MIAYIENHSKLKDWIFKPVYHIYASLIISLSAVQLDLSNIPMIPWDLIIWVGAGPIMSFWIYIPLPLPVSSRRSSSSVCVMRNASHRDRAFSMSLCNTRYPTIYKQTTLSMQCCMSVKALFAYKSANVICTSDIYLFLDMGHRFLLSAVISVRCTIFVNGFCMDLLLRII